MEMILTRKIKHDAYTLGELSIDGVKLCDTLEPTWRDIRWGRRGAEGEGAHGNTRRALPGGDYLLREVPQVAPLAPARP